VSPGRVLDRHLQHQVPVIPAQSLWPSFRHLHGGAVRRRTTWLVSVNAGLPTWRCRIGSWCRSAQLRRVADMNRVPLLPVRAERGR
jgi:hypothetical protein